MSNPFFKPLRRAFSASGCFGPERENSKAEVGMITAVGNGMGKRETDSKKRAMSPPGVSSWDGARAPPQRRDD